MELGALWFHFRVYVELGIFHRLLFDFSRGIRFRVLLFKKKLKKWQIEFGPVH